MFSSNAMYTAMLPFGTFSPFVYDFVQPHTLKYHCRVVYSFDKIYITTTTCDKFNELAYQKFFTFFQYFQFK